MPIARFTGGTASARNKLNELVDRVNALSTIAGDEFVAVGNTPYGTAMKLNIDKVVERMPKFGIKWARAILPAVRSDDCAWINPASGTPYVYGWKSNSAGEGSGEPALSSTTASEFTKIYLPGGDHPNIREDNVIPYYLSDGKYWIGPGGWYDDPIWTVKMWAELTASPTVPPGWLWMQSMTTTLKLPSVDVDTDGVAFDISTSGSATSIDAKQRVPIGSGDNTAIPQVGFPQGATGETVFGDVASAYTPVDIGLFATHFMVRAN